MKFINNNEKYWEFIRDLRNDPSVKTGFIEQDHISSNTHREFMQRYGSCFYLCVDDSGKDAETATPLGFCGVIDDDIRVAVSPSHHGKGVGYFMITKLSEKYPSALAKIKMDNKASLALFEKCGFQKKYYILEKKQ